MPKTYNYWKLMDKVDVAVRTGDANYRGYNGYVVEHGDKKALDNAKDWARHQTWDPETRTHKETHEPEVHTFDNDGFTVTIDSGAGNSSQSGKLSFWGVIVEKDGVKFKTQVATDILVDLIKDTTIINGEIQEKLMFARRAGTQGFLHKKMDLYKEALNDAAQKNKMKTAKKTTKWEVGGVYQSLTLSDICIGELWDNYEEVTENDAQYSSWYNRKKTKLVKREKPVKVLGWLHISSYDDLPDDFAKFLEDDLDSGWVYFDTGKPPARAKTKQLEVNKDSLKLIDELCRRKNEHSRWEEEKLKGRYTRVK